MFKWLIHSCVFSSSKCKSKVCGWINCAKREEGSRICGASYFLSVLRINRPRLFSIIQLYRYVFFILSNLNPPIFTTSTFREIILYIIFSTAFIHKGRTGETKKKTAYFYQQPLVNFRRSQVKFLILHHKLFW